MQILDLIQGSPEWKAARAKYPCASEAPVIMGASKHMTRGELLRLKAAGAEKEFSDYVQRMVLDKGHEAEAGSRAITEEEIGDDLYPVTALSDDGQYLASFDGVPMSELLVLECKQWNEELAAAVRAGATELPGGHEWQLEQQLLVCKTAERTIFVCSDGTRERRVQMEYRRVPGRAEQLKAGWAQFFHDLEHGDHTPAPAKVVAEPVEALPAVRVQMQGALTVVSNLDKLEPVLRAFIDRIPAKPSTDLEFAQTDAACKALKRIEDELDAAEAAALGSLDAVEQMQRLKKTLHALARATRLQREKLVEARKLEIRTEEIARGKAALVEVIAGHNTAIGKPYMPGIPNDFATAIKGKKTVQSVRDSVDQHLADCKLVASEIATKIIANMRTLRELAADHAFLFADTQQLVQRSPDDCRLIIQARITEHKAAEERRAAELAEQARAKIRQEEEAKAQAKARAEQQEREAAERRQREEQEAAARHREENERYLAGAEERERARQAEIAGAVLSARTAAEGERAGNVRPMPTKAPAAAATPPTLRLGQINERIAPLSVDAAGLASLGIPHSATDKSAKLWHEHQFPAIVDALIGQLARAKLAQKEAA